jgi:prolyl oligopeptidase
MGLFRYWLLLGMTVFMSMSVHAEEPYLWLEEVAGDKPLAWVKQRNAASVAELTKLPEFTEMYDRTLAILDSQDRIPYISKAGPYYYNFWRDEKNPRGLWRRTTLEEYRKPQPAWQVVINLDELAAQENENWVWEGADFLRPACDRALIMLSRGGADATVMREFDLLTNQFVADGFTLPEAKSSVDWRDKDSLFVGTDFGPGSLTDSGYPRVVKQWRRGTPLTEAKIVFEGQPTDVRVAAYRTTEKGYERDFVYRAITFYTSELFLRHDGKLTKVDVPDDARGKSVVRDWLFIELRTPWTVGGQTYPAGALLATNFPRFMQGERQFDVLFAPTERKSLASYTVFREQVVLNELDNVKNRLYVLSRLNGKWHREALSDMPALGTINLSAVDADESDDYFMTVNGFLTPPTLYLGTLGKSRPEVLKQSPSFFNAKGLAVNQYEATSKDGTKIPYFEVAAANLKLDGKNPTIISGYGGFQISLLPMYSGVVGAAWLERGGVFVVANIRGGGEFGPTWHQAALKANRHRAYEDFAAVADDLVRRKVTSPKLLGAKGGSNGGLLMGNMLTLFPEKFGALVCQVPLLDMQRYHKLLAGASWVAEYGDPEDPVQWEFLRTFSPFHNVRADGKYPRILFTTSTRDDRVHPGHARKMVAKMQDQGHDVLYYENIEGGHGGAADNKQLAFMSALAYTFLWRQLQ